MRSLLLVTLFALTACGETPAPAPAPAPAPEAAPEPTPEPAAEAPADDTPVTAGDVEAGAKVYATYCTACHQADGSGMNGMLAANFVKDAERLAQPDEVLLAVIRDGKTGKVGVMPPWGATLKAQEMVDVLAYVRATFQKSE